MQYGLCGASFTLAEAERVDTFIAISLPAFIAKHQPAGGQKGKSPWPAPEPLLSDNVGQCPPGSTMSPKPSIE